MSVKKKINFSRSTSVSYECDMIAICIYCWDPDIQDIAIAFQVKGDCVVLPIKASHEATKKKNSDSVCNSKSVKMAHSAKNISTEVEASSNYKHNCWNSLCDEIVAEVFGDKVITCGIPRVLYMLRVYSPISEKYSSHVIYGMQISVPDINKIHMVKDYLVLGRQEINSSGHKLQRNKLHWIFEELYKNTYANEKVGHPATANSIWNTQSTSREINEKLKDYFPVGSISEELNPQIIFDQSKTHQIISPVALFDSPGFTYLDRLRLYEIFLHLSFPYNTVDFESIKPLLTELGFTGREEKAFRALDENYCGELDIYQFMLGITSMDPLTEHGNGPAEFRCRQIFRYYDEDMDGFLCAKDLEGMIIDISTYQNQHITPEQIKISTENSFKIFDVLPYEKIPLSKFLVSVGNLRFRGTSLLYRSSSSVSLILKKFRDRWTDILPEKIDSGKKKLKESSQLHSIIPAAAAKALFNSNLNVNPDFIANESPIQDDDWWQSSFGYILAQHTVSVRRSGFISNISNLLDMERAGEVCNTGLETLNESEETLPSSSLIPPRAKHKHRVEKQVSAQAFNIKSFPNELLSALRYFESPVKDKKAFSWGPIDKLKLAKYITSMCRSVIDILDSEQRLLHISSPCYILGDLHGNFHDLICFEKALWRLGPHLTPASFLFLGDYVDRGEYGIEVVAYLFAQKLKAPNRFHLLRGNHEVREIQQAFSFYSECIGKFGPQMGSIVWEEINQVFDRMPLAAIVDKKIFCIHGGVPFLNGPLSAINDIPCPLPLPESQSPLAWQLMWNDPVSPDELNENLCKQLEENQGFANNLKRQTAYVFDEKAFERFLEKHKLTHVIRAHEVKQNGFEIQQSGRLFTVFSSSQYCGTNNEAACILVHDLRIRIIRIDTTYKSENSV